MAARTNVLFKFEKDKDAAWLAIFDGLKEAGSTVGRKEIGTSVIASLSVKKFSLKDHQFIQLILDMKGSKQRIVYFPRALVAVITQGVSPEKLRKIGFQT